MINRKITVVKIARVNQMLLLIIGFLYLNAVTSACRYLSVKPSIERGSIDIEMGCLERGARLCLTGVRAESNAAYALRGKAGAAQSESS